MFAGTMNETVPLTMLVTIDETRAQMLWHAAAAVAGFDLDWGFEVPGSAGPYVHDGDAVWDGGRLMWCDSGLEAMVLADYERACGFASRHLWDVSGPAGPGHVVLSARPMDR